MRFRPDITLLAFLWAVQVAAPPAWAQLAPSLPRGSALEAGFDPDKLAQVDELLKAAVESRQIAGGAVLVARRGQIVHLATAGMQDAEAGLPIRADTIYRLASMTKPITSVAAMMLAEEGKLRLDDPVAGYIPQFEHVRVLAKDAMPDQPLEKITVAAATPVTVRHLLTHTSGLTYRLYGRPIVGPLLDKADVSDGPIETPGTMADNVRRLDRIPLLFQPGTSWEYGLNTDVLGRVVEVASGQTLDAFFRARIFEPLGMRDTHFVLPAAKRGRLAALYAPDEEKRIRRVGSGPHEALLPGFGTLRYSATYPLDGKSLFHSGGAGLVSTIGDYARFLQMLLNGGELDGKRLLQAETVRQMTTNQVGDLAPWLDLHGDKFGYGFGIVTESGQAKDVARVGSYSWGGIFYTYFQVDPREQLIFVSMAQIYPFDHLTLHADLKKHVYEALIP